MFAMTHTITINEEQRQLLLLALAWLSLERPGFELALRGCAEQVPGGPEMFGAFKDANADQFPRPPAPKPSTLADAVADVRGVEEWREQQRQQGRPVDEE